MGHMRLSLWYVCYTMRQFLGYQAYKTYCFPALESMSVSAGFYFRKLHPDVEVVTEDLDALSLEAYDELCGEVRRYLPASRVKAYREQFELAYGRKRAGLRS